MHLQQYHHQHTQFLQVKCPSHHSTNSVKALMVMKHTRDFVKKEPRHLGPAGLKSQKTHSYVQQLHRVDRPVNFLAVSSHSLANKTVVQLQPKSTTGSSFLLKYIRYFCRRVWSITLKNFLFRVSVWVNNCLYPFMLNISLILLHKWFCWCRYRYIVVILVIPYAWRPGEGYGYGSYCLTYISCSHYKSIVTQNA